jgi:Icc protein
MQHSINLLHITDPHILAHDEDRLLGVDTAYYLRRVLTNASEFHLTFNHCLVTGDLTQHPSNSAYQRLSDILVDYPFDYTCLPGNHDDFTRMQNILDMPRIDCKKHLILANWQIICLNSQLPGSAGGYVSREELDFLDKKLTDYPSYFSVIAIHHHLVPSESKWMDTMIIENAHELFKVLNKHSNVRTVIHGHIHQEMDRKIRNIRLCSTPSTCFQFKPGSETFALDDASPGFRWLTLHDDGEFTTGIVRLQESIEGLTFSTGGY